MQRRYRHLSMVAYRVIYHLKAQLSGNEDLCDVIGKSMVARGGKHLK